MSESESESSAGESRQPSFTHRPGDAWEAEAELRVGGTLALTLLPAGGYRWSTVESSDPASAVVSGPVDDGGATHATVTALRAGEVILSATTSHTGDRFGPPTRRWRMTLLVVP
jgi:hypothetical protein